MALANQKFQVKLYPTAKATDVLFYEVVDEVIPANRLPSYGQAHPDTTRYPNHKLCLISTRREDGKQQWWYAADRENQDDYNWEVSEIALGGTQFDSVTRTYFTPRADYNKESPAINAAMPDVPEGRFSGAFLLFSKSQAEAPDERLRALYVVEQHVYLRHTGSQTKIIGQENLTPAKYRGQAAEKQTTTLHNLLDGGVVIPPGDLIPDPDTLTGDELRIEIAKLSDEQFLKTVTEEVIDENAAPLAGQRAYVEREVADTEEKLVNEGTSADEGLLISQSSVTPIGNGKSIKETVEVPSWTKHPGSEWDELLEAQIRYTEQFVAPPTVFTEENTSFRPVNKDRALKIVQTIPTSVLDNYLDSSPIRINLNDLPRELLAIHVEWNDSVQLGDQNYAFEKTATGDNWSISADANDSANASSSVHGDLQLRYRDVASNNLYGTRYEFFMESPITTEKILAKLATIVGATVNLWPVFRPESSTITVKGQSVSISARVSVGLNGTTRDGELTETGWYKGDSADFGNSITNQSVQIGACIHGSIAITGGTTISRPVAALAGMTVYHSSVGTITATKTLTQIATGSVHPVGLAATGGITSIPTSGYYLHDMDVSRFRYGFRKIVAVVFNAAVLGNTPPNYPWNV